MGDSKEDVRLYVWVEDRQHKPVFSPKANLGRGSPALMILEKPVTGKELMARFNDVMREHSEYGGGNAHEHHELEVAEEDIDVYLLPVGAKVSLASMGVLRDDDRILIRAGLPCVKTAKEKNALKSIMVAGEEMETEHVVTISYKILGVHSIDTVNQVFHIDFLIMGEWHDYHLEGMQTDQVDWDIVWNPEYDIINAMDCVCLSDAWGAKKSTWLHHDLSGKVHFHQRFKGTLFEPMELECFPFDHQALHIMIGCKGKNVKNLVFAIDEKSPRGGGVLLESKLLDWDLRAVRVRTVVTDPRQSLHGNRYSEVHINIHAVRKEQYYLWNIGIILLAITSLSFCVFAMPPEQQADRLALNFTLALTAMAFKFVVNQCLPVVAFLTPLDKYLLFNFGFLYLCIAATTITGLLSDNTQYFVDKVLLTMLLGLFVSGQTSAVKHIQTMRDEGQKMFDMVGIEEYGDAYTSDGVDGTEVCAAEMYTHRSTEQEAISNSTTGRAPPVPPLLGVVDQLGQPLLS